MAASSFQEIREKIRRSIRDANGLVWDDDGLDRIIDEAQREYAILSGSLVGSFVLESREGGVSDAPSDFIEPVKFIGSDNFEKPLYSWRYLHKRYPDFRAVTGTEVRGIVTDFDGYGKVRLFPVIPGGIEVGTLYYKRLPAPGVIETTNIDAIEAHCLFQAFLLSDHRSAESYYSRFMEGVNRESHVQRGLNVKSRIRRGRFF
jgi:hypothetical protein